MDAIFRPAELLLPAAAPLPLWSVIACDQFTSDAGYWKRVEAAVGDSPSALRLMLPELYLASRDAETESRRIAETMRRYLADGVFRTVPQSFVFLERTLPDGAVRRGLVGVLDLEAYDYGPAAAAPVRATEHTVEERLPARVRVRQAAPLEMPHSMLFLNDPDDRVMRMAEASADAVLYDFDLMEGGGHVRGRRIHGAAADALTAAIASPADGSGIRLAVGDGNHSLAAARKCWLAQKAKCTAAEAETHPARFALTELVNLYDPAIAFAPIHRVIQSTDPADWLRFAAEHFRRFGSGRELVLLAGGRRLTAETGLPLAELIDRTDGLCRAYTAQHGGGIDYIHGDAETAELASRDGCCGILLPALPKDELFSSVAAAGPFPKKSFSIGLARDKRYYLECRKIR